MRYKSKKNAAIDRRIKPARDAFRAEMMFCANCGGMGHDVHEIARGAARHKAKQERCAWLFLCRSCHDQFDNATQWPVAKQLALKLLKDPVHFDPARVCEMRGRAITDVTLGEIVFHLELIR